MQKIFLLAVGIFFGNIIFAQKKDLYIEQVKAYQKNYITTHEVVAKKDHKYFHFFPISKEYNVTCSFEKITDTNVFYQNSFHRLLWRPVSCSHLAVWGI